MYGTSINLGVPFLFEYGWNFLYYMREIRGSPMKNNLKKDIMFEKMKEHKKEVKTVRKIVLIIAIVLFLMLGIVGISTYSYIKSALQPMDKNSNEEISIVIPMGSGITAISKILEENGIIKDKRIFKYYTKFKNESQFQAGEYKLTKSMTPDEIIKSLKTGRLYREPVFTMTIPEGLTLKQIATIVAKKTDHTEEQFMEVVTSESFINEMMSKYPTLITEEIHGEKIKFALEGYLYPATYPFYEESPSIQSIVDKMIKELDSLVVNYVDAIEERGMTVHEFLTFASLLEEEATAKTDRETIASVFYNRIKKGMPLQTDPTVLYALGSHKDRVLYSDLEVVDPYNTYKVQGLPPGPIAGAGKVSLEATLSPTDTDYYYFLADSEGINHFSKTYDEHLEKVSKYIKQ